MTYSNTLPHSHKSLRTPETNLLEQYEVQFKRLEGILQDSRNQKVIHQFHRVKELHESVLSQWLIQNTSDSKSVLDFFNLLKDWFINKDFGKNSLKEAQFQIESIDTNISTYVFAFLFQMTRQIFEQIVNYSFDQPEERSLRGKATYRDIVFSTKVSQKGIKIQFLVDCNGVEVPSFSKFKDECQTMGVLLSSESYSGQWIRYEYSIPYIYILGQEYMCIQESEDQSLARPNCLVSENIGSGRSLPFLRVERNTLSDPRLLGFVLTEDKRILPVLYWI